MWDYTNKVIDHFRNPQNVGRLDDPDGVGEVGSIACGDALRLMFKLDENGRIKDVKFQTFGCASAIASSSVLTEMIKGMTLEEASRVTNKDIVERLGELPSQKMHCSVMGQEALEAAIQDYYKRKGGKAPEAKKGTIVCTCFGVTDEEIKKVVRQNNLITVEDVTNYCKAGGGCGGCRERIAELIQEVRGERPLPPMSPAKPARLTNIQKIQLIQQTINEQIRPALRADGGDIDLIDVEGNKVIVAFRGMCAQCRMAEYTMKDVVEARLKEYVSGDLYVEEMKD
ncbi:MAG TPA: Fe-S cluster assembly protein NifU [Anaerohalosphaeraceae bacterium]|nr:Fe-S cluster assembly protein NifU [Anaerohalosphaeraceae bacterium]HOL31784.1 Fe-S cluster assembly protein NifU [Anaerohalosphaeraceae bacterium]HPC64376.1 Fe-S cluster assembly protein NifU [Anaerohalosphaeraceae bacterium]HRS70982.1 Fe-S cluster assembly protein NifU [Anaerohalosphaeraceae bacterium]HRV20028.1 Fe-S cluster assembly protein NifU [Anaerohalosphaeraceae bacterium]